MELADVAYGLNSKTRRQILQLLSENELTAPEIYQMLGDNAPVYRQSVNKALDILEQCKLVTKYYNSERKVIQFSIVKNKLIINLEDLTIK